MIAMIAVQRPVLVISPPQDPRQWNVNRDHVPARQRSNTNEFEAEAGEITEALRSAAKVGAIPQ